jgi:hypothetical protein
MSRSRKLPIYKDKGWKKYYWKNTRSSIKNSLRSQLYNDLDYLELPNPKTIINDYTYSDYTMDFKHIPWVKYKKIWNKFKKRNWRILDDKYFYWLNKLSRK